MWPHTTGIKEEREDIATAKDHHNTVVMIMKFKLA